VVETEQQQVYKVLYAFTVKANSQEQANEFILERMKKLAESNGWEVPQALGRL
jgi:hypothetical protein